jgi:nucleotide-binding universal stress UspA family protein
MTTHPPAVVLAATDFSDAGNAAVALAYDVAAPGGTVHLVHFIEPQIGVPPHSEAEQRASARLQALAPAHAQAKGVRTQVHVIDGPDDPGTLLERESRRHGAELVVLGSHGRKGWAGLLTGSVAAAALKKCTAQVVLVRPTTRR